MQALQTEVWGGSNSSVDRLCVRPPPVYVIKYVMNYCSELVMKRFVLARNSGEWKALQKDTF